MIKDEKVNIQIYGSTFQFESRILKETQSLKEAKVFNKIIIFSMASKGLKRKEDLDEVRTVYRVPVFLQVFPGKIGKLLGQIEWQFKIFIEILFTKNVSCLNAHSLSVLPLTSILKKLKKSSLVYDAHELETETVSSRGARKKLAKKLERYFITDADLVIVVSPSIECWYKNEYGIKNIITVRNAPQINDVKTRKLISLKDELHIPKEQMLFIYQGLIGRGRGIEHILEIFKQVQHAVVFMGYGNLEELVKEKSKQYPNIYFYPAVKPEEVLAYAQSADVGLALIEDVCLSYRYCLPNKLFEYCHANLPAIVSDLPDMRQITTELDLGWVIDQNNMDEAVRLIQSLTLETICSFKMRLINMQNKPQWQSESQLMLSEYRKLLNG